MFSPLICTETYRWIDLLFTYTAREVGFPDLTPFSPVTRSELVITDINRSRLTGRPQRAFPTTTSRPRHSSQVQYYRNICMGRWTCDQKRVGILCEASDVKRESRKGGSGYQCQHHPACQLGTVKDDILDLPLDVISLVVLLEQGLFVLAQMSRELGFLPCPFKLKSARPSVSIIPEER